MSNIRTKPCRHIVEKGYCSMQSEGTCTFAHSYEEWNVKLCGFDGNPCINPNCLRYHPREGQTKEQCALLNRVFFPVFQPVEEKEKEIPPFIIHFEPEEEVEIVYVYEDEDERDILDVLREEDGDGDETEFVYPTEPSMVELREKITVEIPRNLSVLPYDQEYAVLKMLSELSEEQIESEINEVQDYLLQSEYLEFVTDVMFFHTMGEMEKENELELEMDEMIEMIESL
jgi:hypothetical protein